MCPCGQAEPGDPEGVDGSPATVCSFKQNTPCVINFPVRQWGEINVAVIGGVFLGSFMSLWEGEESARGYFEDRLTFSHAGNIRAE